MATKLQRKKANKGWDTLAGWLVDVSKYLMTGILLSSVFKDIDNKFIYYSISLGISVSVLLVGIYLKNMEEGK